MASKAKFLAHIIKNALDDDQANQLRSSIASQLKGFREVLISDISHKEFSDIYAQTIAYGMFAARLNLAGDSPPSEGLGVVFNRTVAANLIPVSNPFLRKLFHFVAGFDLDERMRWVVDDLADLFNFVNIEAIGNEFQSFVHHPIIHFYETFLAEYDPALRKSRGVWYTPQPVVKFIVQAVDDILKSDFALPQGLADSSKVTVNDKEYHRVQILDPAAGTGTFLAEVVQNIYSRFTSQQGIWQSYAALHLTPRINGFEILMASYAMAHLKLDMLLQQTGYKHSGNERLRIFLTNSLDEARSDNEIPFAQWLGDEANQASHVKRDVPVMVVLGNPPYSGESQNSGKWMERLMNDYKKEPSGIKLQEKNSKWINDDYVKFIRYGQHFIEKNGEGILAFINNHSFLDNPTFRGMRYSLLKTFDKIYILDLHGNAKKKETVPDGGKDENVFDIQQGVSINIFVKTRNNKWINPLVNPLAVVHHYDLYGKRAEKYSFLFNNNLQTVPWRKLELTEPQYFFVAKDFSLKEEYEKGFSVQELFPVNSVGIVTANDSVFINTEKKTLLRSVKDSLDINPDENLIRGINYRPFDNQYVYYDTKRIERARENVMQHFLIGENVGLISIRRSRGLQTWNYVFLADCMVSGSTAISSLDINYVFPLYVYVKNGIADNDKRPYHRHHNLNERIIEEFSKFTGLTFNGNNVTGVKEETENTFAPIDVLDYIYAVLHSPTYRERYKEFLKIDFPRVPYPQDATQFWALAKSGGKLRRLHLMEGVEPQEDMADYPVAGSNEIEKPFLTPCPSPKERGDSPPSEKLGEVYRVYINETQYFDHVPPEAWNFHIGGYQPAQKWLKDRKGRVPGYDDIVHYQRIIRALKETGDIQNDIDCKKSK